MLNPPLTWSRRWRRWCKIIVIILGIFLLTLMLSDFIYGQYVTNNLKEYNEKASRGPSGLLQGTDPYSRQSQSKIACLLIHGYSDSPATFRYLTQSLDQQGYDYKAMLLPGHGTSPEDLATKTWQDWIGAVEREYMALQQRYKTVYVIGFSTGGTLAIHLAKKHSLDGMILIAPYLQCPKVGGIPPEFGLKVIHPFLWNTKYFQKIAPPGISDPQLRTEFIDYQFLPVDTTASLFECGALAIDEIPKIQCPVLILHGSKDRSADPEASQNLLFNRLPSTQKSLVYFPKSEHVVIMDVQKDQAIQEILKALYRWGK